MSKQQLLENRKQLQRLHHNNPNYVSRPPIGDATSRYYPAKESECFDMKWRPSTKNVQLRKSEEFVFRPSCKLVQEPWARESRCIPRVNTQRKEYEISAQTKVENDRKAFLGRGKRDNKQWNSTVYLTGGTPKPRNTQPTSQLKDLLEYKHALPFRDDMSDRIRFRDYKQKQ